MWHLGASQLTALTSLVLHNLPKLHSLTVEGSDLDDLPGLAALSKLLDLTITGTRAFARVPASLSALVNMTRLEIALGPSCDDAAEEPLFGRHAWRPWGNGASPLDGCSQLRELILTDDGPRLTFPRGTMGRLTSLRALDLGGVRAPVLDRRRLLTALPSLARLTVPRGVLKSGLVARLGRRSRVRLPRLRALFGVRPPAGCDVVVEEVGEGPDAAAPGDAAPAGDLPAPRAARDARRRVPRLLGSVFLAVRAPMAALFLCVRPIPV
jgi:hypothetical protein